MTFGLPAWQMLYWAPKGNSNIWEAFDDHCWNIWSQEAKDYKIYPWLSQEAAAKRLTVLV